MRMTLKVYEGQKEITSRVFPEGVVRVGRSEFSDLVLDNEAVSRSHIEIRITENSIYVTNMSFSGSLKLNGELVETAEIKDGDAITVGPFRVVVFFGDRDQAEPVESPQPASPNVDSSPSPDESSEVIPFQEQSEVRELHEPSMPGERAQPEFGFEGSAALNRAETVIEQKPLVAKLMFMSGPRQSEEMMLEAYEVSFGRSKKVDIFLDDPKLSRQHAKIARVGMGYRLFDLGSRNGTFVNGMRILEHPLTSFDEIELGDTKIRFLIHDIIMNDHNRSGNLVAIEPTKSVQFDSKKDEEVALRGTESIQPPRRRPPAEMSKPRNTRVLLLGVLILGGLYLLIPPTPVPKPEEAIVGVQPNTPVAPARSDGPSSMLPPNMPQEYGSLKPEDQRKIEGFYNLAIKAEKQERFEEAVEYYRKIHEVLPFYKDSRDRLSSNQRKLREVELKLAQDRARQEEKQDLNGYIDEGVEFLKQREFARAGESFQYALNIDPNNAVAAKGMKAAELKISDLRKVPPDRDPEQDRIMMVRGLFEKAIAAFRDKRYQESIDAADSIRKVKLKSDTEYLNEAKKIIDRARLLQKELFEPFLIQAKEKYAEGDYNTARNLCEEMLNKDPAYLEASDLMAKAKKQLNRLAKEAYTHGYILESMNRIEEAKQYWTRAKNYVRPGDDYYDKVIKKLEYYQ